MARAYDTPIPGYGTFNTIGLRLWKSHPANEFDFSSFNTGDYFKVISFIHSSHIIRHWRKDKRQNTSLQSSIPMTTLMPERNSGSNNSIS